jgi:multiple sugar transport system substrate-binding protein
VDVTVLRGITWDHVRGLGGLAATAEHYARGRPGVLVEWSTRSLQSFADQPVDELARRFELLYIDHPSIGHAVARGCLAPLDELLDAAFLDEHLRGSVGRSAEGYVWEGHTWALATDAAAQVACYRGDLLERAGLEPSVTWDDVLRTADELRRQGMWMAMPAIPVDVICVFLAACVGLGEEPLIADDVAVSRDVGRAALDLIRAVIERGHPSSLEWNPPGLLEHMSSHDDVAWCPLAFGYSNYARPGFRHKRVLAAPGPGGVDGAPRGTLGGAGLAVSRHAEALDEAVRYARFVADPDTQRTVYFAGGGQPGHRGAWVDRDVNAASGNFFRDTLGALDAAYLRPRHDGFLAFQEASGQAIHDWLRTGGDPQRVLDAIDAAHRDGLRRNHAVADAGSQ